MSKIKNRFEITDFQYIRWRMDRIHKLVEIIKSNSTEICPSIDVELCSLHSGCSSCYIEKLKLKEVELNNFIIMSKISVCPSILKNIERKLL